jgi:hypothetical protein
MTPHARAGTLRSVKIAIIATVLVAAAIAAAPASADSIVYAKDGNLFLTSPDGSKGYQLTFDGGYSSPSQADDGTIGALRYKQLVRMNRSGQLLNAPIAAMGSDGVHGIGGPYEPRISPDGKRFAYYFYVQTSFDDWYHNIEWIDTGSYATWTWADHFTGPATESEYLRSYEQPEWVSNDRLLGDMGMFMNMWTWKLGTGHGYTYQAGQWWFGLQDPPDEWGVAAYHWYTDPALSRDGSKLAMTDGEYDDSQLLLAATHGPAWSGEPPYPEPDYVNPQSDLNAPTIECVTPRGKYSNPSWSQDGHQLAYGTADGVHVMSVPSLDCPQITERLLVPGGVDPAFGPADVNMGQAPAPPAGSPPSHPGGSGGTAAAALSKVSLKPRNFRAGGRGTKVSYTLSAPSRVTLTVVTKRGKRIRGAAIANGKAGRNTLRFRGRMGSKKLKPGSYRLMLTPAGGSARSVKFKILR